MIKTIKDVRLSFWDSFPEFQKDYRKTWQQNQYNTTIRMTFVDYVDSLNKNGVISDNLAFRVTL